jgi:hypothetical protein
MTKQSTTEANFDGLLDATLAEWPDEIDVTKGIIYDETGGRFDRLVSLKDQIENKLISSDRLDLAQMNWALFTVLHKAAMASNTIRTRDIRREMVRFFFDRSSTVSVRDRGILGVK